MSNSLHTFIPPNKDGGLGFHIHSSHHRVDVTRMYQQWVHKEQKYVEGGRLPFGDLIM